MNKIHCFGCFLLLSVLTACGDAGGADGNARTLVDPSDPNALSEVLIIPGAERVQGSPPEATGGLDAPVIVSNGDLDTTSGGQAVLEVDFTSPSGYAQCYVQVVGADDYFVIDLPSDETEGTIQIPVTIPEDVDSGAFDLYTCIAGDNGSVSNAVATNVGVMNRGGSVPVGEGAICASDDPSVGTLLPCGGGTQVLDFCIELDTGACFYAVGDQQVNCGNCNSGDVGVIQACADRAVELCF